jgi:hypothetical protein
LKASPTTIVERGLLLFTSQWSPGVQNHPRRIPGAPCQAFRHRSTSYRPEPEAWSVRHFFASMKKASASRSRSRTQIQSAAPSTSSCSRQQKTTHRLNSLETGDQMLDVVGPRGKPSEIANYGTVVVVGGSVGAAMAYRTAAALKRAGNRLLSIVGARNKELAILEPEMRAVSDLLMITTDDGSCADKGFITDKLCQLMQNGTGIDLFVAAGPIVMMKAIAEMTRKENLHPVVSLNP